MEGILPVIIFSLVGLLIIFLCYLVKFKQQAHLIAGYDEKLVPDKAGFCNWFGGVLVWLGIYLILSALLLLFLPSFIDYIIFSIPILAFLTVFIAIRGGKKYIIKP